MVVGCLVLLNPVLFVNHAILLVIKSIIAVSIAFEHPRDILHHYDFTIAAKYQNSLPALFLF